MIDKRKKEVEQNYIQENKETGKKELILDTFFTVIIQKCIGKALDEARISPMPDRQLNQFMRTVKDHHYQLIDFAKKILKDFGYEVSDK